MLIAQGGSPMDKQIIAALEIADHEVRLLIGQFFNGRLNILKVERVAHQGVVGYTIASETHVVDAIKKAVENASRNLGVLIESVLFILPGVHLKRIQRQRRIPITGRVSSIDIRRIYNDINAAPSPEGFVLINTLVTKFFINGSSTRKVPMNEKCDSLTIEAECYYGKESIVYPYVGLVEKSGLRIIDLVVDDIGYAKEASLFEASIDKPIVAITLNNDLTRLALFHHGTMLSNDYLDRGFKEIHEVIKETFNVPQDVVKRLLYNNIDLNKEAHNDPIFMWSTKSQTHTMTQHELFEVVEGELKEFMSGLIESSEPIFQLGTPRFILTGEASVMEGLDSWLVDKFNVDVTRYRSTTFGVKDPSLTSIVGSFYYYKDQEIYREQTYSSVNLSEFESVVLQSKQEHNKDDSITQKLKNMFFER